MSYKYKRNPSISKLQFRWTAYMFYLWKYLKLWAARFVIPRDSITRCPTFTATLVQFGHEHWSINSTASWQDKEGEIACGRCQFIKVDMHFWLAGNAAIFSPSLNHAILVNTKRDYRFSCMIPKHIYGLF